MSNYYEGETFAVDLSEVELIQWSGQDDIFIGLRNGQCHVVPQNTESATDLLEAWKMSKEDHRAQPAQPQHPPTIRGCLHTGPGRGDCYHFLGLPEKEDETTCDEYGRPHGWCEICWLGERVSRAQERAYELEDELAALRKGDG